MASQIISLSIVRSTSWFRRRSRKTTKLRVTGLCEGNSLVNYTHKGPQRVRCFHLMASSWSFKMTGGTLRNLAEFPILTFVVRKHEYSGKTRPRSWLLMPWLFISPVHPHSWYWQRKMSRPLPSMRKTCCTNPTLHQCDIPQCTIL